jgi:hypothetical protein
MTIEVLIAKTSYRLHLNVRHWSTESYDDSVILQSPVPFAPMHQGERLTIGDLAGWPESRLTHAVVERVLHSLTGGPHLKHDITVYAVQDREP